MKIFQCQACDQPVSFESTECESCQRRLGYVCSVHEMSALEPSGEAPDRVWHAYADPGRKYRFCANAGHGGCNWLVPEASIDPFCTTCRHNRVVPDLDLPWNLTRWRQIEAAKHRLFYTLLRLELPLVTREQYSDGLAFDFLVDPAESQITGPPVLTGHDNGLITLNIAEADDVERERRRMLFGEFYRTLLGHFRHEIGHYYWDRLVYPTDWLFDFRELFGDERASYADALRVHYEQGPRPDWAGRCVTSYASAHPWEDWAETWAHYLHMADAADTAMSFGVDARNVELSGDLFDFADLWQPDHPGASKFLDFLNGWVRLTNVLNELSRSMGQSDYYPFTLPRAAVGKLQFIHQIVTEQRLHAQAIGEMPVPETTGDDGTTDVPEEEVGGRGDGTSDDGFAPVPSAPRDRTPAQVGA